MSIKFNYSRIVLPFFIILLIVILVKFYKEYTDIQELKVMIASNESESVSKLIQAFRKTYQKAFLTYFEIQRDRMLSHVLHNQYR